MGKATIYDYARFMRSHCFTDDECAVCPLKNLHCGIDGADSEELTKINEIILNWCKEHPIKTRQDELLKMFPNAKIVDGIIGICPKHFETAYACKATKCTCHDCRKGYWLAEVDENE